MAKKPVRRYKKKRQPTPRQSRFAEAFMKSRNLKEAALAAGYSPKNPSQSAHQALKQLKVPEILDAMGYTIPALIEKYLAPKLTAMETKFAQEEGKFTDYVEMDDHGAQLDAIHKMLSMHGAYAPRDPKEAAQFGIKVVIIDVPRPQHGIFMEDVGPAKFPPGGSNGHKPDKP